MGSEALGRTAAALLDPEEARTSGESLGLPDPLTRLNVFRVLLRRERAAKAISDLLLGLMFGSALDARLRELVIMRVAWKTGSEYEWAQHWRIATEAGVSEEDLLGVRAWPGRGFDPPAAAALALADEMVTAGVASPPTLAALEGCVGGDAALEAVLAAAAWAMLSSVLRSLRVPLEEGTSPWPPDGAVPESRR